jgi:hypothetical protein
MIVGAPAVPIPVTDPDDPRLANFRDLTVGTPPGNRPASVRPLASCS